MGDAGAAHGGGDLQAFECTLRDLAALPQPGAQAVSGVADADALQRANGCGPWGSTPLIVVGAVGCSLASATSVCVCVCVCVVVV